MTSEVISAKKVEDLIRWCRRPRIIGTQKALRGVPRLDHPPWCEGVLGGEHEAILGQPPAGIYPWTSVRDVVEEFAVTSSMGKRTDPDSRFK